MLDSVKNKCGIPAAITTYDDQISDYIEDALEDMRNSGVPYSICDKDTDDKRVVTAVTLYVKANLGDDPDNYESYLRRYKAKVFRLTMEPGEDDNVE